MSANKFVVISGSTRTNSQSGKVARYIANALLKDTTKENIEIIDLAQDKFPLWDEAIWSEGVEWNADWAAVSKKLSQADAVVVIAPEWHGMVPAQLKNLFQLCSNKELFHKPALIVGVSSSPGGAYPVAELRVSSYKNSRLCYIPEHVIIRYVGNVLNEEQPVSEEDKYIRERLAATLDMLNEYASAFKQIRQSDAVTNYAFPNGM